MDVVGGELKEVKAALLEVIGRIRGGYVEDGDKLRVMMGMTSRRVEVIFEVMMAAILRGKNRVEGDGMVTGMVTGGSFMVTGGGEREFFVGDYERFVDCIVNGLVGFYRGCVVIGVGGKVVVVEEEEVSALMVEGVKDCVECLNKFDMEIKVNGMIGFDRYYLKGTRDKKADADYVKGLGIENGVVFINSLGVIEGSSQIDTFDKKIKVLMVLCILKYLEKDGRADGEVKAMVEVLKRYRDRFRGVFTLRGANVLMSGISKTGDGSLNGFVRNENRNLKSRNRNQKLKVLLKMIGIEIENVRWGTF